MCACEHHYDCNAPCTCSCPSHEPIREQMAADARTPTVIEQRLRAVDIEAVLREHHGCLSPTGGGYLIRCECGWTSSTPVDTEWDQHRAHVAAAIRAALTAEGDR